MSLTRRHLLELIGLTGTAAATGALGLPRAVARDGAARAADGVKRLILMSTTHGTVHDGFAMNPAGWPADAAWDLDLGGLSVAEMSPILRPLHRHRHRLLTVDGLSMATAELDIQGYRHEKGWLHAWTGELVEFTGEQLHAGGPSLDQIVARQVRRPDRLPSLELAVGDEPRPVSHAGRGLPLPLEASPKAAFDRMFGVAGDRHAASSRAVMAFVEAEFEAALGRTRGPGRDRLAAHRDMVAQLGARLEGLAQATCDPAASLATPPIRGDHDTVARAQIETLVAGMACDMVRVGMLSWADLPGNLLPERPGSGDVHDSWAHQVFFDETARLGMIDYGAKHAEYLALLLDRLEATPDPQGGSLLDHTLVVWANELGDGWHGYAAYDVVIAGGGWHFETGRHVHHPARSGAVELLVPTSVDPSGRVRSGVPHQHLLVSVAQAMGVDTDTVGLGEVVAQDGTTVDLTGPLAGLTGRLR